MLAALLVNQQGGFADNYASYMHISDFSFVTRLMLCEE